MTAQRETRLSSIFWRARSARRRALLAAVTAAVFTFALLFSLAAGLVTRAPEAQLHQVLQRASTADRSLTVTASGLDSSERSNADRAITDTFAGVPITTTHTTDRPADADTIDTWTISPRVDALTIAELPALHHGFNVLPGRLDNVLADAGGAVSTGSGASTVATILQTLQTVRSTDAVPLGVIAVAGTIAIGMLARLLVVARAGEDRLLRSRGASGGLLLGRAAIEATWIAVPATIVGTAVAQVALEALFGAPSGWAELLLPPTLVVAVGIAAPVVVAISAATRPLGADDAASESTGMRAGTASAAAGGVLLLLVLGGLATWRSIADGGAGDPLAVIAPAIDLCALSVLAAALFGPGSRLVERPLSRRRGLEAALASRLTARGAVVLAPAALLVALAIAAAVVASGTAATSRSFLDDSARLVNGGSARLTFSGDQILTNTGDLLPAALRSSAVDSSGRSVAPVLRSSATVSQATADVIGVRASALPALVPVASSIFGAQAAARALRSAPIPGPVIRASSSASSLTASVRATVAPSAADGGAGTQASATLWLVDPVGDVASIGLPAVPVTMSGGAHQSTIRATIPAGGPWTIAAVDADFASTTGANDASFTLSDLVVGGTAVSVDQQWDAQQQVFGTAPSRASSTGITTGFDVVAANVAGGVQVRLLPAGSTTVPVLESAALQSQTGLNPGTTTTTGGNVAGFTAKIVGVVPSLPGTTGEPALLADLPTLVRGSLAASPQIPTALEAWVGNPSNGTSALQRDAATVQLPSTALESRFVAVVADSLWLGAIGSAVFAVLAIAATIASLQRRRRPEAEVLRGLGVPARVQARMRIAEPASAVLFALVTGAIAGGVTAALLVPSVARAAAPSAPGPLTVALRIEWWSLGAVALGLALCSVVLIAAQYRATLRTAGDAR